MLEDWADEPLDLMGFTMFVTALGWLMSELLREVISSAYQPHLREVVQWSGYAFVAALLSTMIVGWLDNMRLANARKIMPWFCLAIGMALLWSADWSVGAPLEERNAHDMLWGRFGAVLVVLGLILCVGKILIPTTKRHRFPTAG